MNLSNKISTEKNVITKNSIRNSLFYTKLFFLIHAVQLFPKIQFVIERQKLRSKFLLLWLKAEKKGVIASSVINCVKWAFNFIYSFINLFISY